jgi:hypothetical protein
MFIFCYLFIDALGVGYQNDNLTRQAVNETGLGTLRSGNFPGGTKEIHKFPQDTAR